MIVSPLNSPVKAKLTPEEIQEIFAAAEARGVTHTKQLLAYSSGSLETAVAAEKLGVSPTDLDKLRQQHKVLGVLLDDEVTYVYPAWQFVAAGQLLPGLAETLQVLKESSALQNLSFLLSTNLRLNGLRPLEALQQGFIKEVIVAASVEGEHIAD